MVRKIATKSSYKVDPIRSKIMAAIKGRNNKSTELRLRMILVSLGISGWKMQKQGMPGRPDFYFESRKLIIFVDGCFWHGCPKC